MQISLSANRSVTDRLMGWSISLFVAAILWITIDVAVRYDRRPVIDEDSLECEPLAKRVSHLTGLTLKCRAYRLRECPATITWEIEDGTRYPWREPGSVEQYSRTLGWDQWGAWRIIRPNYNWGPSKYRSTISYGCGWTRFIVPFSIKSPEISFEIVEAGKE